MNLKQTIAMEEIEKQLRKRMDEKHSWQRLPRRTYIRIYKSVCHKLFAKLERAQEVFGIEHTSDLGLDEFKRDVSDNMPEYVRILMRRHLKVHTVIVLGSRVKGRWKPQSDIDVTVIADNLPAEISIPVIGRILGLARWFFLCDIPICMGVEPSGCCSREEFLEKLKDFDILAIDAIYYGKVEYDDGFWAYVKEKFREIVAEYELQESLLRDKLFVI